MTIVRNACRDGALAIGADERSVERDNLPIHDVLYDLLGVGLRADPITALLAVYGLPSDPIPAYLVVREQRLGR